MVTAGYRWAVQYRKRLADKSETCSLLPFWAVGRLLAHITVRLTSARMHMYATSNCRKATLRYAQTTFDVNALSVLFVDDVISHCDVFASYLTSVQ